MKVIDHPVITILLAIVLAINSFCFMAVGVKSYFELTTISFSSIFELVMYLGLSFIGYLVSIKKFRDVQYSKKKAK